jgi:hypothetical protein
LGGFNETAFPHDPTSRPGFATEEWIYTTRNKIKEEYGKEKRGKQRRKERKQKYK